VTVSGSVAADSNVDRNAIEKASEGFCKIADKERQKSTKPIRDEQLRQIVVLNRKSR
jgi:hypothetical protein